MSIKIVFFFVLEGYLDAQSSPGLSSPLAISLWKVYPDTAVFDWYISLKDKYSMSSCNLSYGPVQNPNQTLTIPDYLPQYRLITIHPLKKNTSYWLSLLCTDKNRQQHYSTKLFFSTASSNSSLPRVGARYSQRRQDLVSESVNSDVRYKFVLSRRKKDKVSPHSVLGAGCAVVLLVLCTITSVLVLRKYARHGQETGETTEDHPTQIPSYLVTRSPSQSRSFGENEELLTVSLHCHCQDQELDKVDVKEEENTLIDIFEENIENYQYSNIITED